MKSISLVSCILLSILVILLLSSAVQATEYREVNTEVKAEDILKHMENGEDINLANCHIVGELNVSTIKLGTIPNPSFYNLVNHGYSIKDITDNGFSKNLSVVESSVTIKDSILENGFNFSNTLFKNSADFTWTRFNSSVDLRGTTFNGSVDFEGTTFNGSASFWMAIFNSSASFSDARFNSSAGFVGTIFNSSASFSDAKFFNSSADFMMAIFNNSSSFSDAKFFNSSSFKHVTFNSSASFSNAKFFNSSSFQHVTFNSSASFSNAKFFNSSADFTWTRFNSSADFTGTLFNRDVNFTNSEFDSSVDFMFADFKSLAYFGYQTFKGSADFTLATFDGPARFGNATFKDSAKFERATFNSSAEFGGTIFNSSAKFENANFKNFVNFTLATFNGSASFWMANFDDSAILLVPETSENILANGKVCEFFRKSYNNEARYTDADNIYYNFRKKSMDEESLSISKAIDFFSWFICGYGVRPFYILRFVVTVILFFSILYTNPIRLNRNRYWGIPIPLSPNVSVQKRSNKIIPFKISLKNPGIINNDQIQEASLLDIFYYSICKFTFMSYENWYPRDNFRMVAIIEGIIGWATLGIFMAILTTVMIRS